MEKLSLHVKKTIRMPSPRRKLRRHDRASTRELILAEAMRLMARDGVEQLKLKDIADAVGIRTPSIYKHFLSRDAIVMELARQMVEEMRRFLRPDSQLDPRRWMESWARGVVSFFAHRPAYVRMILRDLSMPGGFEILNSALGPVEKTLEIEPLKQLTEEFAKVHARGVKAGIFRPVSHSTVFALVWGAVMVSVVWPYSPEYRAALSVTAIEQLQHDAAAIALRVLEKEIRNER